MLAVVPSATLDGIQGRLIRVEVGRAESTSGELPADLVIKALGFDPEDLPGLFASPDLAVTRWREDATSEDWGSHVYLRDAHSGRTWSAAAPTVPTSAATRPGPPTTRH